MDGVAPGKPQLNRHANDETGPSSSCSSQLVTGDRPVSREGLPLVDTNWVRSRGTLPSLELHQDDALSSELLSMPAFKI